MGPIPWDKIISYALFVGLDDDNCHVFLAVIRAMDAAYMKVTSQDQKKAADLAAENAKPKGARQKATKGRPKR